MTGISRHNNYANRESMADKPAYRQSVPADNEEERADSKDELANKSLRPAG